MGRRVRRVFRSITRGVRNFLTGGADAQKELAEKQAKEAEKVREQEKAEKQAEEQKIADEQAHIKRAEKERQEIETARQNAEETTKLLEDDGTEVGLGDVQLDFSKAVVNSKEEDDLKKALAKK